MRFQWLKNILTRLLTTKFLPHSLELSLLIVLGILLYLPSDFLSGIALYIFQNRDFTRAQGFLNGNLIFFGPEISGGGNLPGPFYYLLLAVPLALKLDWLGTWYWMIILSFVGGLFGWYYFRAKFNSLIAFFWLLLFSLSFSIGQLGSIFLNPGFTIFFIVLINIYTLKAFSENTIRKRNRTFILACFLVGLTIQLHYSSLSYILALITLYIFSKKLKIISINFKSFCLGLVVFALTLLPYLLWLVLKKFDLELGQAAPYTGIIKKSEPYLSVFFNIEKIFTSNFLLSSLKQLTVFIPLALLIFAITRLLCFRKKNIIHKNITTDKNSSLIKISYVCLFFTVPAFSFIFFVPGGYRYVLPFIITISFITTLTYAKFLVSKENLKYFNQLSLITLVLILLSGYITLSKEEVPRIIILFLYLIIVFCLHYKRHQKNNWKILLSFIFLGSLTISHTYIQKNLKRSASVANSLPRYWQWKIILSKIYSDTGWSYLETSERIYFINHHPDSDLSTAYNQLVKKKYEKSSYLPNLPDGYFVSIDESENNKTLEWIIDQPIQNEVRKGLLTGDIVLGQYNSQDRILIVPYYIINKNSLPISFHNTGLAYNKLPEGDLLHNFQESPGIKKLENNHYLFKWNECPSKDYYCDTGVIVSIISIKRGLYKLNIKIIGLPLSQVSQWVFPGWTQAWIKPYIEIKCGEKTQIEEIISSVGYNRKNIIFRAKKNRYYFGNNSILAPLKRSFEIHCNKSLSEISIGREGSEIEQITNLIKLPKQKLTLKL